MNTLQAIRERRSVKYFDPKHKLSATEIKSLMEHACLSPTSFNMQNWRFVLVTDSAQKEKLKAAAYGQAQVADAAITLVLCAHLKAHEQAERYWSQAPEAVQKTIVPMIHQFYENKPELQHDEALRSIGIVSQTLMLAAKAMGYDSCPMIGFDPKQVAKIIQLPPEHEIGMLLPIGKALKPASPRSGPLPMDELCFREHF